MHPDLKWWNEKRIAFYLDAARNTSFHSHLAKAISKYLCKDEEITEIGSGLSFLAENLRTLGYEINASDIDCNVIGIDRILFPNLNLSCSDYRNMDLSGNLLSVFFLRNNEIEYVSRFTKKMIIVRKREKELPSIPSFSVTKEDIDLSFDQVLKTREDGERFLEMTYGKTEKKIEESGNKDFPFVIRNEKKLTIYMLQRRLK